jgi:hypothetical protein
MKLLLTFTAILFTLAGCCHPLPVIAPSMQCTVPDDLAKSCAAPALVKDGITYAELLSLVQEDRANLRICGQRYADFVKRAKTCEAGVAAHNEAIRKINEASKK